MESDTFVTSADGSNQLSSSDIKRASPPSNGGNTSTSRVDKEILVDEGDPPVDTRGASKRAQHAKHPPKPQNPKQAPKNRRRRNRKKPDFHMGLVGDLKVFLAVLILILPMPMMTRAQETSPGPSNGQRSMRDLASEASKISREAFSIFGEWISQTSHSVLESVQDLAGEAAVKISEMELEKKAETTYDYLSTSAESTSHSLLDYWQRLSSYAGPIVQDTVSFSSHMLQSASAKLPEVYSAGQDLVYQSYASVTDMFVQRPLDTFTLFWNSRVLMTIVIVGITVAGTCLLLTLLLILGYVSIKSLTAVAISLFYGFSAICCSLLVLVLLGTILFALCFGMAYFNLDHWFWWFFSPFSDVSLMGYVETLGAIA